MKARILTLTVLSLSLAACGNKNGDPLKGYEELANDIPVGAKEIKKQTYAKCGSKVTAEKLVVVEAETASVKLTVTGTNAARVASYAIAEPVKGLSLSKVKQSKIQEDKKETANVDESVFEQEYKLTMSAARGIVSQNEGSKIITSSVAPQNQVNSGTICSTPVQIEVQKIKGIPSIASVTAPKKMKYDSISDVVITINVSAAQVTKVEDLSLVVGFDNARQSKENPITNLKDLKPEISSTIAVGTDKYKYTIKVSGEALKGVVDKVSAQLTKAGTSRMFVDFHASFQVKNAHTKEKSLTHDYILRIDRKPIEAVAAPAATTGEKK